LGGYVPRNQSKNIIFSFLFFFQFKKKRADTRLIKEYYNSEYIYIKTPIGPCTQKISYWAEFIFLAPIFLPSTTLHSLKSKDIILLFSFSSSLVPIFIYVIMAGFYFNNYLSNVSFCFYFFTLLSYFSFIKKNKRENLKFSSTFFYMIIKREYECSTVTLVSGKSGKRIFNANVTFFHSYIMWSLLSSI